MRYPLRSAVAVLWAATLNLSAQTPAELSVEIYQAYAGLTITGTTGTVYSVEYVTDLAQTNNPSAWRFLESLQLPANSYLWLDTSAPATEERFYRVVASVAPTDMVLIPAGSFTMGDSFAEGTPDERPTHSVYVSAFYMDKYEVTKALWDGVYQWATNHGYSFDNPGRGKAADHPVHTVSWYDVVKWCNARSEKEGKWPAYYTDATLTVPYRTGQENPYVGWGRGYRLPTAAEWEKAARGGAAGRRFAWSDSDTIQHTRANYSSSPFTPYDTSITRGAHPTFYNGERPYTSPVGYFAPNGYGLYDMMGNVREWCWDWYDFEWYGRSGATQSDTRGPSTGAMRVGRGGCFEEVGEGLRVALHNGGGYPDVQSEYHGLRVVLSPGQQ